MSQWDSRIGEHAVWNKLQQTGISMDSALERGITDSVTALSLLNTKELLDGVVNVIKAAKS